MRALVLVLLLFTDSAYKAEIEKWRQQRENRLKAEDGWLTLVGLSWLKQGENRVGSAADAHVQLPGSAPSRAGTIQFDGNRVVFQASPGVQALLNGKPVNSAELKSDAAGSPDTLQIGRIKLLIIKRGAKLGVRVKDNASEYRRNFTKLRWLPVREDWQIRARFIPYNPPRKMKFDALAGDRQEMTSPGYVEFQHAGKSFRLTPVLEGDSLFFIFRDKTAGKTTYPAARFLYSELAKDGQLTIDFNKAYNPPCVFTPYATCPLPPPENRLPVPVEAGEMMYGSQH